MSNNDSVLTARPSASLQSLLENVNDEVLNANTKPDQHVTKLPETKRRYNIDTVENTGWVEVLFRKEAKIFHKLNELVPADYEAVGSPVLTTIPKMPFDVYVMLQSGIIKGTPRAIAHGDILNCRTAQTGGEIHTFLIIDPQMIEKTLARGKYRVARNLAYPLGLLALPQKFPLFSMDAPDRKEHVAVDVPETMELPKMKSDMGTVRKYVPKSLQHGLRMIADNCPGAVNTINFLDGAFCQVITTVPLAKSLTSAETEELDTAFTNLRKSFEKYNYTLSFDQ